MKKICLIAFLLLTGCGGDEPKQPQQQIQEPQVQYQQPVQQYTPQPQQPVIVQAAPKQSSGMSDMLIGGLI